MCIICQSYNLFLCNRGSGLNFWRILNKKRYIEIIRKRKHALNIFKVSKSYWMLFQLYFMMWGQNDDLTIIITIANVCFGFFFVSKEIGKNYGWFMDFLNTNNREKSVKSDFNRFYLSIYHEFYVRFDFLKMFISLSLLINFNCLCRNNFNNNQIVLNFILINYENVHGSSWLTLMICYDHYFLCGVIDSVPIFGKMDSLMHRL